MLCIQYLLVSGHVRDYLLHVPKSYDHNVPTPVVLSHHGWTDDASDDEVDSGLTTVAEKEGFIVAYLNGYNDNPNNPPIFGTWNSWNGAGTVNSTNLKPGCKAWGGISRYCYTVCNLFDSFIFFHA